MNTKYNSIFFTRAILTGIFCLVLLGISTVQIDAQIHVEGNPKCADINADNATFPTITSDYGFSTGNAPPKGSPKVYNIQNVGNVTVNYNSDTDINFSASSAFITAVIIKAADGADVYVYDPATASGGPLPTPLKNGKNAGLSHLVFCYDEESIDLGTTAAHAMVAGRVQAETGKFRGSVLVTILNTSTLETQTVQTNRLGFYQFEDLTVGDTYIITVRSKGFTFAPQSFTLNEDNALDMLGYALGRSDR